MASRQKVFSFSDAWIFTSLGKGLSPDGGTPLVNVHQNADMLNHAIPTFVELVDATRILFQHGLVEEGAEGLRRTEYGEIVAANGFARRGGLFRCVSNMLLALNSNRFRHPQVEAVPKMKWLTLSAYNQAVAQYLSLMSDLLRKD